MVVPNKPDEDWYWPVEILYTSAFFTFFLSVFAVDFLNVILFSNNKMSSAFAEETSHLLRIRFGGKV